MKLGFFFNIYFITYFLFELLLHYDFVNYINRLFLQKVCTELLSHACQIDRWKYPGICFLFPFFWILWRYRLFDQYLSIRNMTHEINVLFFSQVWAGFFTISSTARLLYWYLSLNITDEELREKNNFVLFFRFQNASCVNMEAEAL